MFQFFSEQVELEDEEQDDDEDNNGANSGVRRLSVQFVSVALVLFGNGAQVARFAIESCKRMRHLEFRIQIQNA